MSLFQVPVETELREAHVCVKELAVLIKVLDLLNEQLLTCECTDPNHLCNQWMVKSIRSDLEAQLDVLGGNLKGFERFVKDIKKKQVEVQKYAN